MHQATADSTLEHPGSHPGRRGVTEVEDSGEDAQCRADVSHRASLGRVDAERQWAVGGCGRRTSTSHGLWNDVPLVARKPPSGAPSSAETVATGHQAGGAAGARAPSGRLRAAGEAAVRRGRLAVGPVGLASACWSVPRATARSARASTLAAMVAASSSSRGRRSRKKEISIEPSSDTAMKPETAQVDQAEQGQGAEEEEES